MSLRSDEDAMVSGFINYGCIVYLALFVLRYHICMTVLHLLDEAMQEEYAENECGE